MTYDPGWALQRAIYQKLSQNTSLQNAIGTPARIYDTLPADAIFPFLVIGDVRISDWVGVEGGLEHDIQIWAYSSYRGQREVKAITASVYETLHDQYFDIEGSKLINIRFKFSDNWKNRTNTSRQAVMRYRAVTQPLILEIAS